MADLSDLLEKTSRTFALSIPLLPPPIREEVTVAYLLFRIADTFEDAATWPQQAQLEALSVFSELLDGTGHSDHTNDLVVQWLREPPIDHDGYTELLGETPTVLKALANLRPEAQPIIRSHLKRTAKGMAEVVTRREDGGNLTLVDLDDLKSYCYVVAGIVGEMLTELFLLGCDLSDHDAAELRESAALFGEGLQLVNILKDSERDSAQGRIYLPPDTNRSEVFRLARTDLDRADAYNAALRRLGAPRSVLEFTTLPVLLARASLDRIEAHGPGAKLTRPEVFALLATMEDDLADYRGAPASLRHLPSRQKHSGTPKMAYRREGETPSAGRRWRKGSR